MLNVILDTDIGPDCDDAGALRLLNVFADMGLCRILGVVNCTSNPFGAGAIDAICKSHGRHDVPVGAWTGRDFLNEPNCRRYNEPIARTHPNRFRDSVPDDAVELYRRLLAAQPDGSVDIVAIGPLNAVSALLDSMPDEASPLSGRALAAQKVRRLTMMAGIFRPSDPVRAAAAENACGSVIEEYAEYNVLCDIAAARNISDNWPTPKYCLGWEAGLMETGASLAGLPEDDPVRMAYGLWNGGKKLTRCSWDPMTVLYAVAAGSTLVRNSAPGTISFTDEGHTVFSPSPDGRDRFAELAAPDCAIIEYIDKLLV